MSLTLYRFAKAKYCHDLSGNGSKLYGGRWNSKGVAAVYTSLTISLSLLELFIHSISYDELSTNKLLTLEVPDNSLTEIAVKNLKPSWETDTDYTKYIGDGFFANASSLLLKIPSAIIPIEYNIALNPLHKDFSKIKILGVDAFSFDSRLFKDSV